MSGQRPPRAELLAPERLVLAMLRAAASTASQNRDSLVLNAIFGVLSNLEEGNVEGAVEYLQRYAVEAPRREPSPRRRGREDRVRAVLQRLGLRFS